MKPAAVALFTIIVLAATALAQPTEVRIKSTGSGIELETEARIRYPPEEVWPVVLDFDGLAGYMPNVDSSRVIMRTPSGTTVRQVGTTTFVVARTITFELVFRRLNQNEVAFEQVHGDFDDFRGVWSVRPEGSGSRVGYKARITESFGFPGFLVRHVVRRDAAKMMPAIEREVRRRHGTPSQGAGAESPDTAQASPDTAQGTADTPVVSHDTTGVSAEPAP